MKNTLLNHKSRTTSRALPLLAAIAAFGLGGASQAAVTVNGGSSLSGGTYTYTYSVTNSLLDGNGDPSNELLFVDVPFGAGVVVFNLTAPVGFQIFDSGLNSVTFAPDNSFTPGTFAPGSTNGDFSFQSTAVPSSVTFSATDAFGDTLTGQTISAVPEPSGLMLLAASALPLIAIRRRRNR